MKPIRNAKKNDIAHKISIHVSHLQDSHILTAAINDRYFSLIRIERDTWCTCVLQVSEEALTTLNDIFKNDRDSHTILTLFSIEGKGFNSCTIVVSWCYTSKNNSKSTLNVYTHQY